MNLLKGNSTIESDDTREGLQAIVSVKLKNPEFEGQNKGKLRMTSIRSAMRSMVESVIQDYLAQDQKRAKIIVDKVLQASKAREAAARARNTARGIKSLSSGGAVENFADCSCKDPEQCEIFLVEGDSAGGSAKMARNRKFQAILPVFGKILNAEKSTLDKVISSAKLADLVKVLRTGIGPDFDINKLRYHRIILMSDADCL